MTDFRVLFLFAGAMVVYAQDLSEPLVRQRLFDRTVEDVWAKAESVALNSDAIINALDDRSHLISLTFPLKPEEARRTVLEQAELSNSSQMAHATIWVHPHNLNTQVYVRATVESEGIFLHSNGRIESEVLNAIDTNQPWRKLVQKQVSSSSSVTEAVSKLVQLQPSTRFNINLIVSSLGLATVTLPLSSDSLKAVVQEKVSGLYPGLATVTIQVTSSPGGPTWTARSLIVESGHFGAPPLSSSGKVEAAVARLANGVMPLEFSQSEVPVRSFGSVVFAEPLVSAEESRRTPTRVELPESVDRVWPAALDVITQLGIITACDREGGVIDYVVMHAGNTHQGFAFHHIVVSVQPSIFGTNLFVYSPKSGDTPSDVALERQVVTEKVATELFVKERLSWLVGQPK